MGTNKQFDISWMSSSKISQYHLLLGQYSIIKWGIWKQSLQIFNRLDIAKHNIPYGLNNNDMKEYSSELYYADYI